MSNLKSLLKPPKFRLKNHENEERHATWLELFFDLIFVVAIAELSGVLSEDISLAGVSGFVILFIVVWWCWLNATYYSDLFDTDDIVHRTLTATLMVAVSALAVNLQHAVDETSTGFAVSYVTIRILLAAIFLRAGWHIDLARPLTHRVATCFGLSAMFWLASTAVPVPLKCSLWLVGMAIEIGMTLTAGERVHVELAPHDSHLPERFGLFTIIVLGESVFAVVHGVADKQWSLVAAVTAVLCFVIAFCLWWIYFDNLGGSAIRAVRTYRNVRAYQVWMFTHLPLSIGLVTTGVAVHHILTHSLSWANHWLLCASVSLCFVSLGIINLAGLASGATLRCQAQALRRFGAAGGIMLIAIFGGGLTALGLSGCIAGICVMQVASDFR
jgi:low temperature requirement protein LtrA